jgi:hypothetical protein
VGDHKRIAGIGQPLRELTYHAQLFLEIPQGQQASIADNLTSFKINRNLLLSDFPKRKLTGTICLHDKSLLCRVKWHRRRSCRYTNGREFSGVAVSLAQFVDHVADSGLLARGDVQTLVDAQSAGKRPKDVQELARLLVKQKS